MMTERTGVASAGFWIFDNSVVALETPTASIEVTRPQEIDLYTRMFEHVKASAAYGAAARALIIRALGDLLSATSRNIDRQLADTTALTSSSSGI